MRIVLFNSIIFYDNDINLEINNKNLRNLYRKLNSIFIDNIC